ncbi:methyl-accepting chemotaxis protein [Bradyrhizobium roseum]|nr:methyl-accepting chemotaxis protein [Bradyrhizobium roseus]WKA28804.1 methyl-accepting chemotaxis protein [Bradyrhizobium roseus]
MNSASSSAAGASSGLFGFFTNRRINTKIMIGFAVVLALLAVLSVLSYRGFGKVSDGFEAFNQRVKVVSIARNVDRNFVAFRRFVREFSISGDESLLPEARRMRDLLEKNIKQGLDDIKNPERRGKMAEIGEQFDKYAKNFDKLIALKQEQNKLTRDVLDPLGTKSRVEIEELQTAAAKAGNSNSVVLAGEAVKLLMQARLNVNKLLGRHEESAAQGAEKALAALKKTMTAFGAGIVSEEARKIFVDVNGNVEKYTDAYHKAAHDAHEIEILANGEMAKEAQAIAAAAESIKESGIAEETKIEHETIDLINSTEGLILIIAISSMILGIALAWLIGRAISKPVIGLCAGMRELADGNFEVVLPGLGRGDEVGDMAQAVEIFKVKAEQKARAEAEAKAEQDQILARQRKADMIKLADSFESAVGEIIQTVSSASTELEASATTLTGTAERSQELTTMVAAASEEASTNVQSVASATEELSSSVNEISRQVQESARMANEAVDQARNTNDRVAELSKAASRIGDVVELINTIAGQTNLLALNATIEAARAGEAGRGFAVVASEVKALAEQTAKATGEIGQQISGIQAATQESVGAIKEISGTIEKLSEISSTIAAAVEEQGAATQEISRNVQQAAQGTQQVSSNIADVQRGASETGSASSQVLSAAQMLSGDSNRLQTEVGKFLATVRAA